MEVLNTLRKLLNPFTEAAAVVVVSEGAAAAVDLTVAVEADAEVAVAADSEWVEVAVVAAVAVDDPPHTKVNK